ncbi:hypothetical protein ACGGAQ_28475 [Micromonospora sp. NPDC047557]|uniref:hypothetical protein n=1 Tax=Micromonospora sp. NPDC047557 TaxID=3364250 RepID=UPI00371A312B
MREFDLVRHAFAEDGFTMPEAKSSVCWIDADRIFVPTDCGRGSLTSSGYPRLAKRWRRGKPLSEAKVVHEGQADPAPGAVTRPSVVVGRRTSVAGH